MKRSRVVRFVVGASDFGTDALEKLGENERNGNNEAMHSAYRRHVV